ncbi:microcin-processing peptidase [Bryobacterales bacterium F-183]|nr:microcin-processing peptidase [Bryobacterales bacterium F-183]
MTGAELEQIAQRAVQKALELGADDAEVTLSQGSQFSVSLRMGEIEKLKQSGSSGAGIRVLRGKRTGSGYTSDLTADGIEKMVVSAIEIAAITTEDPHAGMPDAADLGKIETDLQMYYDDVLSLTPDERIQLARKAEETALAYDARITNSDGAGFGSGEGVRVFANSRGFSGNYRYTSCSLYATPVAKDGASMERDSWGSTARSIAKLESPEEVGRVAGERVIRRLHARKVATQKCPVVFDRRMAGGFIGHLFEAVNGTSIYRKSSFLAGKIGERVASEHLTLIDDPTIPGLFGSYPFDDEGVPGRRKTIIRNGVLESYLLNTYCAKKLDMKTTGNASRGLSGNAGVGIGNFYLEPGTKTDVELIRSIPNGLYVTELIGSGVSVVTGDYSRGAAGVWIENGELAYPVHEITIAGNLREMLMAIEAVGSDLEFRSSIASPTLVIGEMTVSGK